MKFKKIYLEKKLFKKNHLEKTYKIFFILIYLAYVFEIFWQITNN